MDHRTWQRLLLVLLTGIFGLLLIGESFISTSRWINQPFPGFFVHEILTVAPYFMPSWTGTRSGLRSLDRLVTAEDRPLHDRAELYEIVRRADIGTPIHYRDRGRERLSPSPPSEPCVQFSRTRLSSRWFPHRDWYADT